MSNKLENEFWKRRNFNAILFYYQLLIYTVEGNDKTKTKQAMDKSHC